jgi:tetratricopeptide (TPR) repeat protein/spermidine synthase
VGESSAADSVVSGVTPHALALGPLGLALGAAAMVWLRRLRNDVAPRALAGAVSGFAAGALGARWLLAPVAGVGWVLSAVLALFAATGFVSLFVIAKGAGRSEAAGGSWGKAFAGLGWAAFAAATVLGVTRGPLARVAPDQTLLFYSETGQAGVSVIGSKREGAAAPALLDGDVISLNNRRLNALSASPEAASRLGHVAMLLCPSPKTAWLLGAEATVTAEAMSAHPGARVTVVDPYRGLVAAAMRLRPGIEKKVRFHGADELRAMAGATDAVDVIVSAPRPRSPRESQRQTLEFLRLARARLAPSGLYAQGFVLADWPAVALAEALGTARSVFPSVTLWALSPASASPTVTMICAERPPRVDLAAMAERLAAPATVGSLRAVALDEPSDLLALFLCDGAEETLPPSLQGGGVWRLSRALFASAAPELSPARGVEASRLAVDLIGPRRALPRLVSTPARDVPQATREGLAARANAIMRLLAVGAALAADDPREASRQIILALQADAGSRLARATAAEWGKRALVANHYDEAVQWFEQTLALCPAHGEFHRLLALAHQGAGRPFEARQVLEAGSQAAPDSFAVWFGLGLAHADAGEVDEAIRALERAKNLAPDNAAAQQALRALGRTPRSVEGLRSGPVPAVTPSASDNLDQVEVGQQQGQGDETDHQAQHDNQRRLDDGR